MTNKKKKTTLFDPQIIRRALIDSLIKLNPRNQIRNPVMFVVEIGSIMTTLLFVRALFVPGSESPVVYTSYLDLALGYRALCKFRRIGG